MIIMTGRKENNMQTNLTSFYQALKDNFKGIENKAYISESLRWHFREGFITAKEYQELVEKFL